MFELPTVLPCASIWFEKRWIVDPGLKTGEGGRESWKFNRSRHVTQCIHYTAYNTGVDQWSRYSIS